MYAYGTDHNKVDRNINTPKYFTAPGYTWKPGSHKDPGHNLLICCIVDKDEKNRSCCF